MSTHTSQTGTEPGPDRRAVAAVVALLLVSVLAIGFVPGLVSAADTLEREGSDLVINVSEVDNPNIVAVKVTDPAEPEITYTANATDAEDGLVHIDVREPDGDKDLNGTDLRNTNVTVTVESDGGNATTEEVTNVPLHTVAVGDPAWIDDGEGDNATGRLYVPLDADGTAGISTGTDFDVDLDLDGNGTADVTGTVRGEGTQLVVDRRELIDAAGDSRETLDVRVLSSAGPVSDESPIEPELRSTRDGLALWHPLFAPDETYAVNAKTIGEDARYTAVAAETHDGYLGLPELSPGETEIRVSSADGTTLISRTDDDRLAYAGPSELSATVTDGGTLRFDRSLAGLGVDGALVETGDGSTYAAIDGAVDERGNLALDGVELNSGETLSLSTTAGDVSVTLEARGGGGATESALISLSGVLPVLFVFFVPLVVGLGTGGVITLFQDGAPDNGSKIALGVMGFALAAVALIAIQLLTSITVLGSTLQWIGLVGIVIGAVGTPVIPTVTASRKAEAVSASSPFAARVAVTDGSNPFRGKATVHYREPGGRDRYDPVTVRGGRETIQLPGPGTWEVYARHGSARSSVETVDANNPSVTLTVPVEATLTVVDATDNEPVANATISGEAGISETTGRNGAVTLDPPEDAMDAEIEVSHDRYANATERVRFRQGASHTVELDRRTGQLRGSAQIDGAAAGAVPLRIVPDDEFLSDRFDVETVMTGGDGTLDGRPVPIGQYRIEATLGGRDGIYEDVETTVTVNETGSARAEIDARFTWRLDDEHRDRIDRLRRDVRSLSDGGGRDGAIPRYYASVVESMLGVAERVPDAGHEFVDREVDPSEAVDGTLEAAERATDAISEAMTTKRNVDLFAACADMPDANVRWSGSFELGELLDRLEAGSGAQRREVKQRYETVDGLIEDRRGELSEIAPAREMQQRAWQLTRDADRGPEAVAIGYTSLLLLDAVEDLFEHDALRERLTRTVF